MFASWETIEVGLVEPEFGSRSNICPPGRSVGTDAEECHEATNVRDRRAGIARSAAVVSKGGAESPSRGLHG